MDALDKEKIRNFYNTIEHIWDPTDKWHTYTHKKISTFLRKINLKKNLYILNAGSGGNSYNLYNRMHHVDVAEEKINKCPEYTVSSIESMPFKDDIFDVIICVGSVINYCDAAACLSEFNRVLKPNGLLILEFENSHSYEYFGKKAYKKNAYIVDCIFQSKEHRNWVYSHEYICKLLTTMGFNISSKRYFHILSSLVLRLGFSEKTSSWFAGLDVIFSLLPPFRSHSGNVFLICHKK